MSNDDQPGFCDDPNTVAPDSDDDGPGFYMNTYPLDKDYWVDGFGWGDAKSVDSSQSLEPTSVGKPPSAAAQCAVPHSPGRRGARTGGTAARCF